MPKFRLQGFQNQANDGNGSDTSSGFLAGTTGATLANEATRQHKDYGAHTYEDLYANVTAFGGGDTVTISETENGTASSNLTVSASGTGIVRDGTGTEVATADDLIGCERIDDGGMHSDAHTVSQTAIVASAGVAGIVGGGGLTLTSDIYWGLWGSAVSATASEQQTRLHRDTTMNNLRVYASGASGTWVCGPFDGTTQSTNVVVSVTASGETEDTTGTEAYSSGEDISVFFDETVAGTLTLGTWQLDTDVDEVPRGQGISPQVVGTTDLFAPLNGGGSNAFAENAGITKQDTRIGTEDVGNLSVFISAVSSPSSSVFALRLNTTNSSNVTVAPSGTGLISDMTGTETLAEDDEISFFGDNASGSYTYTSAYIEMPTDDFAFVEGVTATATAAALLPTITTVEVAAMDRSAVSDWTGRVGPYKIGTAWYTVIPVFSLNALSVMKAATEPSEETPGDWVEVDQVAISDLTVYDVHHGSDDDLYIASLSSSGTILRTHTFDPGTDAFTNENEDPGVGTLTASDTQPSGVGIHFWSNSDRTIFYGSNDGADDIVTAVRWDDSLTAWQTAADVFNVGGANYGFAGFTVGGTYIQVHGFDETNNDLDSRSIDVADTLGTLTEVFGGSFTNGWTSAGWGALDTSGTDTLLLDLTSGSGSEQAVVNTATDAQNPTWDGGSVRTSTSEPNNTGSQSGPAQVMIYDAAADDRIAVYIDTAGDLIRQVDTGSGWTADDGTTEHAATFTTVSADFNDSKLRMMAWDSATLVWEYWEEGAAGVSTSIAGVVATATGAALLPTITSVGVVSVAGVLATATAAALLPAVEIATSIAGIVAEAPAAALLPTITSVGTISITALVAEAPAVAELPTITSVEIISVAGVLATATAAALLPAVQIGISVAALVAEAPAVALLPTITAVTSTTIAGVVAEAPAAALLPTITSVEIVSVSGLVAEAPAAALLPTITSVGIVSVAGVVATADADALLPAIEIAVTVTGLVAEAPAAALLPTITSVGIVLIAGVVAIATAAALLPTITANESAPTAEGPLVGGKLIGGDILIGGRLVR